MRVLIVDNGTLAPALLERVFSNHEITTRAWNELDGVSLDKSNYDFAVLSGSSNFPVVSNEAYLEPEMNLIRAATIPILGICYGFELIVTAFGGTLKMLPKKEQGVAHMLALKEDPIFAGIKDLFVYEGHRWTVDTVPDSLIPLAESEHGIEAVRHVDSLIYGLQFHPEKLEHETAGEKIIANFIVLANA